MQHTVVALRRTLALAQQQRGSDDGSGADQGGAAARTMTVGGVVVAAEGPGAAAAYWKAHALAAAAAQRDVSTALKRARAARGAAEARAQSYRYALMTAGEARAGVDASALLLFARDQWAALETSDGGGLAAAPAAVRTQPQPQPQPQVQTPAGAEAETAGAAAASDALGAPWLAPPRAVDALVAELGGGAAHCSEQRRRVAAEALGHHLERLRAAARAALAAPPAAEARRWESWQRQRCSREQMARRLVEVQNECTSQLAHAAQQSAVFQQKHAMAERRLQRRRAEWVSDLDAKAKLAAAAEASLALAAEKQASMAQLLSVARTQIGRCGDLMYR